MSMRSGGTPSNLATTIKCHHTNFLSGIDSLVQGLEKFKKSFHGCFSDLTQQSLDLEDRLDNVQLQKNVLLGRYEILQRKQKEGCKACLDLEKQLVKKSGIIKQYEVKLKNIAKLLHINIANTEANQKQLLMSNLMNTEQVQTQNSPCHDRKHEDRDDDDKEEEELEENVSPEKRQRKNKNSQGSKILVHENEDEEYFETTIRRKTPENAETVMEIPETFCEDLINYDHNQPKKLPRAEKSPEISYETPSKKRKFAQLSPLNADLNASCSSQRSPNLRRAENQIEYPTLSPRNKNLVPMKERNLVALIAKTKESASPCNSPFVITTIPKLNSEGERKNEESEGKITKESITKVKQSTVICNSPSLITKPKLKSQDERKSQESEGKVMLKDSQGDGKVRNKSINDDDGEDKEQGNLAARGVSEDEDDRADSHQQNRDYPESDETRFPLLEPMDKEEEENDNNRESKQDNNTRSPKSCKQLTSQSKVKKMNASKVWENIEFSDDDDDDDCDDFIETNKKSKQQASRNNETNKKSKQQTRSNSDEKNEKSIKQQTSSKEDQNISFAFAKPAAADTSKSKWKLKVAGGGSSSGSSSINKSTRLKQTKLSMEKKVGKIDITQVEGYNGGVTPTGNNSQRVKDNSETAIVKETLSKDQKRLIIEETQLQSEDDSDTDIEGERKELENAKDATKKQKCGNESSEQNSRNNSFDSSSSDTERKIRVRPLSELTLSDESMMFQPNAVSTQKTKSQAQNTNICKQAISTRQIEKTNSSPSRRNTRQSPKKNEGTSSCTSPLRRTTRQSPKKIQGSCTTPKSETRTSSSRVRSGNSGTAAAASTTMGRSNNVRKPLFLPKEAKESKKEDFTSKWMCQECIDYFVDGYGASILKIRPPPKKCGHNGKYPATPPDFWDPMCS